MSKTGRRKKERTRGESEWMTQEEARSYLGVHANTLYRWMRNGILGFANTRPRMVKRADVERRAKENWYEELEAHRWRISRPKMRPIRRDGVPLVSAEAFLLCAPYGYMAVEEERHKIEAWRALHGRGNYDYAKERDWIQDLFDEKRVLTSLQAAEILEIDPASVRRLADRGKLVR